MSTNGQEQTSFIIMKISDQFLCAVLETCMLILLLQFHSYWNNLGELMAGVNTPSGT